MYVELQSSLEDEYKIQAAMHGVDLGSQKIDSSSKVEFSKDKGTFPVFGDPADYAHLSKEARELLTEQMQAKHRTWANNTMK